MFEQLRELATAWALGAVIGLGQLLSDNKQHVSARLAVGRALVSGGLGASAPVALFFFPEADPMMLYGLACALASLGTSALEALLERVAGK